MPLGHGDLDITDADAVARVLDEHAPVALVNCAAQANVDLAETEAARTWAVNATAPGTLARLCAQRGVRLVHISTDYVLDGPDQPGVRLDEHTPPRPRSAYARSKLAGEEAALAHDAVVVRVQWVHHPGGRGFFTWALRRLAAGEAIRLVTDQVGIPTPADWLARQLLQVAGDGPTGLFHIAPGGEATAWQWIEASARVLGLDLRAQPALRADFPGAFRPARSCLDATRFSQTWDVALPDWQALVADTLARHPMPWDA